MPQTADQYAKLADLYDLHASSPAFKKYYREWREALLAQFEKREVEVRTLIDLACGTGNTTVPWAARRAWTVVGVDGSPAMLRQARRKSKRVRWYCQDLRRLKLEERAEAVTCHFDALNHILDENDLQKVFENVAKLLTEEGLFQFDMNTEHWLRWLNNRETANRTGANVMIASNEFDPRSRIATFRQLWFVRKGRMYEKREISVRERAYSTQKIRRMLTKAGLRLVESTVQSKLEGKPVRMLYLAVKTPGPKKSRSRRARA